MGLGADPLHEVEQVATWVVDWRSSRLSEGRLLRSASVTTQQQHIGTMHRRQEQAFWLVRWPRCLVTMLLQVPLRELDNIIGRA